MMQGYMDTGKATDTLTCKDSESTHMNSEQQTNSTILSVLTNFLISVTYTLMNLKMYTSWRAI